MPFVIILHGAAQYCVKEQNMGMEQTFQTEYG